MTAPGSNAVLRRPPLAIAGHDGRAVPDSNRLNMVSELFYCERINKK